MSVVFIILYPLGAISVHLPIDLIPGLRNSYLRKKIPAIHMPIQILGTVLMIGGFGLGIRIAHDVGYLSGPVHAHIVIGLLVVSVILLIQPAMGILQHLHYKRTGNTSAFGYVHRWVGRVALVLGIVNNGLGFQLAAQDGVDVPVGSYIRNFVIAGGLFLICVGLIIFDWSRSRSPGKLAYENGTAVKEVPNVDTGVITHA
jgi:hypothetical protein